MESKGFPTTTFLKLLKERPQLYDESYNKSYNVHDRKEMWQEISRELYDGKDDEKTVQFIKSRWKFMRDSFSRSYKLYKCRKDKGAKFKVPSNMMSMWFLVPHIKIPKKEDQQKQEDGNRSEEKLETYSLESAVTVRTERDLRIEEMDETDQYFLSLARTVKKFKPLNKALVKKTITTTILDMEIQEASQLEFESIEINESPETKEFFMVDMNADSFDVHESTEGHIIN